MKANPGGQIDPKELIGRDALIANLWEILAQQSVEMVAERRIGKTSVMKKMVEECPEGWFATYQDLEKVGTTEEFALAIYREVEKIFSKWRKNLKRASKFFTDRSIKIPGIVELAGQPKSWKLLIESAIADLIEEQVPLRSVLFLDELPYMLQKIQRNQGEGAAMEVLDLLRSLRQTHPQFRMILTGSIGLHHVMKDLRKSHAGNEPLNDLYAVEVTPLALEDAKNLARRLIEGESLSSRDPIASAEAIAQQADCFPFYIHAIVRRLKDAGSAVEPTSVDAIVARILVDENDPWEMEHYRSRIGDYYGEADGKIVSLILDELSLHDGPLAINEISNRIKAQCNFDDRKHLLKLLTLMARDHYLSRHLDGSYGFRFPLIRRWWKLAQGLSS